MSNRVMIINQLLVVAAAWNPLDALISRNPTPSSAHTPKHLSEKRKSLPRLVFPSTTMATKSLKSIAPVPTAADFLDIVLSKTQRKTPTVKTLISSHRS